MPERERRLLHPARHRGRRRAPRFSSGNASSARTVPITTCVSGSWNSVPATAASVAGPVLARVEPADDARGRRTCRRGSAARGPQAARSSVDLPDAEQPGEHDELAGLDAQRRRRAARARAAPG